MSSEKRNNFIIHGGILAMAGILVRIIGMFYRIPLMNIIGSTGIGIYSVAFNIYNIMLVLSSYGLPMAVSKLVSARYSKKQYRNAGQILKCSLVVSLCTGGTAAIILFLGAGAIEKLYRGVNGLAIPLRVLAPTILFVALMGVIRGFFQGQGTMIPTAVSQLVEQIVNAFVSILAGYLLVRAFRESPNVAAYGAAGGTMGTAVGAFAGLLLMTALLLIYRRTFLGMISRDRNSEAIEQGELYKTIIFTMIPIIIGQTLYNISAVVDDIMFSNIMTMKGVTQGIESDLGNFASSYTLLISIPQGVATAMSASMLPSIVSSYTQNNRKAINSKIRKTIKTNMFIAIPSFIGLVVLGQPVIKLLFSGYDSAQGSMMLKIGAIAVVFYTLSTVTSSALQGIDKMSIPVKHSFISLIVHVILVLILLLWSNLGIYAIVIGNATFPILIFILNLYSLNKYTGYRLEYKKTFIVPTISSVAMGFAAFISYKAVYMVMHINFVALFIAMIMAFITYFGILYCFRKKKMY